MERLTEVSEYTEMLHNLITSFKHNNDVTVFRRAFFYLPMGWYGLRENIVYHECVDGIKTSPPEDRHFA